MRSTDAPLPLKRPRRPSVLAIDASVPEMLPLLFPPAPPLVVVFILPVWNRIFTRSSGATQVLAMAPAAPPAISSCKEKEKEKRFETQRAEQKEGKKAISLFFQTPLTLTTTGKPCAKLATDIDNISRLCGTSGGRSAFLWRGRGVVLRVVVDGEVEVEVGDDGEQVEATSSIGSDSPPGAASDLAIACTTGSEPHVGCYVCVCLFTRSEARKNKRAAVRKEIEKRLNDLTEVGKNEEGNSLFSEQKKSMDVSLLLLDAHQTSPFFSPFTPSRRTPGSQL